MRRNLDSSDNIPGLPGLASMIGKKSDTFWTTQTKLGKADKLIVDCKTVWDLKRVVVGEYQNMIEGARKRCMMDAKKLHRTEVEESIQADINKTFKGLELNKAQMERQIELRLESKVDELMQEKFPLPWKDYLRQQFKLLWMLREIPEWSDFELPEAKEVKGAPAPKTEEEKEVIDGAHEEMVGNAAKLSDTDAFMSL